jgi:hypothetical protein
LISAKGTFKPHGYFSCGFFIHHRL